MKSLTTRTTILSSLITATLLSILLLSAPFSAFAATTKAKKSVDNTCMQTAVDTREAAIMEAFAEYQDETIEALTDRKTALHDAWGMSDSVARKAAIKSAWSDWKSERKEDHTELKTKREAAWSAFKTTAKNTCKVTVPKEEILEKDSAGTVSL
jgi:ribonuclease HI